MSSRSFDILNLFTHLLDQHLEFHSDSSALAVTRFGSQSIGLAIELLQEEIESPTDGVCTHQCLPTFRDMGIEAIELFVRFGYQEGFGRMIELLDVLAAYSSSSRVPVN